MAFGLYTQTFGAQYANEPITIREALTSKPATLMATITGGIIRAWLTPKTLDDSKLVNCTS